MLDAGQAAINASLVAVYWLPVVPLLTLGARGIGKQALCLCCGDRRCVHLGAKGCALALDERPFECAVMVPHADRRLCRMPGDTSMEELWLEHQGILREAVELRTGRPWRDELMRQLIRAPVDDAFANGARELIDTLGFASDDASIRETVAAWKTEGVHGGPADG
jgi:hypothetical protein